MATAETNDLITEVTQLPVQPGAAMRLLWMLEDPRTSAADLGRLIESDPALSTQVIRLVEHRVLRALGQGLERLARGDRARPRDRAGDRDDRRLRPLLGEGSLGARRLLAALGHDRRRGRRDRAPGRHPAQRRVQRRPAARPRHRARVPPGAPPLRRGDRTPPRRRPDAPARRRRARGVRHDARRGRRRGARRDALPGRDGRGDRRAPHAAGAGDVAARPRCSSPPTRSRSRSTASTSEENAPIGEALEALDIPASAGDGAASKRCAATRRTSPAS